MSGRVQLDFHVLRRRDFPSFYELGAVRADINWLESQLHEFIQRHSARGLVDSLLGGGHAPELPHDVVASIRSLIEGGWIEVSASPLAFAVFAQAPYVEEEAIPISEPLAPTDASPAEPDPAPTDPATEAQVATLLAAAESGTPFCEVCTQQSAREARHRSAREAKVRADAAAAAVAAAVQVSTLLAAANSGTPFCEICT